VLHPTAYPVKASTGKWTDKSQPFVPEVWLVQFAPPSVVLRIVPQYPTAYPVLLSTKQTPSSGFPCGRGFCQNHPAWTEATPTQRAAVATNAILFI
jgi:hypothetical protein